MGTSRWDTGMWAEYTASTSTKSASEIFSNRSMNEELDPKNITMRESRDSEENPESTAVIVASDVTGSMGMLAENLIRKGLGTLFEEILDRKPVTDPHVMAMAIGDVTCDSAPLQVTQFEADLTIAKQLEKVYVEKGGGGNSYESYDLPMYFAAYHTSIDCFEKRGKKGYLFTLGDEPAPPGSSVSEIKSVFGDDEGVQKNMSMVDVVGAAKKMYNVYHIIVKQGSYCYYDFDGVVDSWQAVLGQNVIILDDYTKLAEVIVSIIEVNEGRNAEDVAASWSGDTSMVVANAVKDLETSDDDFESTKDVVRF